MAENTKCPHCGVTVEPSEDFCQNCFCDLRSASEPPPAAAPVDHNETMATIAQQSDPPPEVYDEAPPADPPQAYQAPARSPSPPPAQPPPQPVQADFDDGFEPPPAPQEPPRDRGYSEAAPPPPSDDSAMPYRPRLRPPMAVLKIHDDDMKDSETIRIRSPEVTFGRSEGDIVIPHERMMSGKHAKLTCRYKEQAYRWYLTDLESTNGSFICIQSGKLLHNAEILLGAFRYRFNAAPQGAGDEGPESPLDAPQQTLGWKRVSPEELMKAAPSLIRITPSGETEEFKLLGNDQVIGSGQGQVDVLIHDDPMLSARHVRVHQDEHRRWYIEDLDSRNGVWLSVREQEIDKSAQFQLGEQRFSIRFP